jgi:Gly-Xaa carboxypeptidase
MPSNIQNYTLLPQGEPELASPSLEKKRPTRRFIWHWGFLAVITTALILTLVASQSNLNENESFPDSGQPACPQFPALKAFSRARETLENGVKDEIESGKFFHKSLKKLQGAVQIPTESFDDMGKVGNDSRWDIFVDFHAYLEETFPLV